MTGCVLFLKYPSSSTFIFDEGASTCSWFTLAFRTREHAQQLDPSSPCPKVHPFHPFASYRTPSSPGGSHRVRKVQKRGTYQTDAYMPRPATDAAAVWAGKNISAPAWRVRSSTYWPKGPPLFSYRMAKTYAARNGMPSAFNSSNASSSVFAVVTIVTSIPRICETLS